MRGRRSGRALLLLAGLALVAAACRPVPGRTPAEAPPPLDAGTPPAQQVAPAPSPSAYVALVETPGPEGPEVVSFEAHSEDERAQRVVELEQTGDVVAVDNEHVYQALAVNPSNDGFYKYQYGLHKTHFPGAWPSVDGTGVIIAVIDTGVQAAHKDLGYSRVIAGQDFISYPGTGRIDPNGHGTHVAGIAAGADNTTGIVGGAPGAKIMPVRVLNASGSGSTSAVVNGIFFATNHGAHVISLSLGGCDDDSVFESAVQYAHDQGVVVVAAAGNNGGNKCNPNDPAGTTDVFPAAYDLYVTAVGATGTGNARAGFSNYNSHVDVAAAGVSILSTYHDISGKPANGVYKYLSGTSMAAPFVSAAVALRIQKCGAPGNGADVDVLADLLQSTGFDPAAASPDFAPAVRIIHVSALTANCL